MSKAGSRLVRALDHAYAQKCRDSSVAGPVEAGPLPQLPSDLERIDAGGLPPRGLVPVSMEGPMMGPAEWDCVFVAYPAAERARLGEPKVMSIRRPPPANQAGLRRYEPEVRAIPVAAGLAQRERAFVDAPGNGIPHPLFADRPQFMHARRSRSRLGRRGAKLNTCSQSGHQGSPPRRLGLFLRPEA
jgi:hypothetical protein